MKMKQFFVSLLVGLCLSATLNAQMLPYQNPQLSSEERAKDLLSRLTLEEKVKLMMDVSEEIPHLGIKPFAWWSEALHGVANHGGVTVFPQNVGMAASFNDALVYDVFDAVSDETRALFHFREKRGDVRRQDNGLSVWTPNVNIFRDPRWGRGQESYGEDPYLMSRMGVAVVRGLQGPESAKYKKLLACAKHYAVHSGPEWNRHSFNLTDLDNRDMWETYMPAFKAVVTQADVRQVMCAYQRLDDDPCCGSTRLLRRILRDEWDYEHIVVSDCGAVRDFYTDHKVSTDRMHASSRAVLSGTDLECSDYTYTELPKAVKRGLIKETDIDESVLRILAGRFDLGDFDDNAIVPWANIPYSVINCEKHQQLALDMARQAMTLLQNKKNILPLSKNQKIAVIGPNANDEPMLWGNYNGTPAKTTTILEGIKAIAQKEVFYDKGCDLVNDMWLESMTKQFSFDGKPGVKATYWNNKQKEGNAVTTVQYDNPINLSTTGQHPFGPGVNLQGFSGKYETEYTATEDGEIVIRLEATGHCRLYVNGEEKSDFWAWKPAKQRIPIQAKKGEKYTVTVDFTQEFDFASAYLNFDLGKEHSVDYAELIKKLKGIDVVVFVGGISPQVEGEEMPVELPGFKGGDRTDIELPAAQRNCIKALKEAGKKIVYVNCSGSAVGLVPESEHCEAILQAWYAGQSGGQAVAEVLFGEYNPSGKLPITFYRSLAQIPDYEDYSMKHRTYRYMTEEPLFRFGHGLSYTTFAIGEAKLSKNELKRGETLSLTIPVKNTGKREGTEIVQVYVKRVGDEEGPIKTLRAFERVSLSPKASKEVVIDLNRESFEWYNDDTNGMAIKAGEYDIYYGASSEDKLLKKTRVTLL